VPFKPQRPRRSRRPDPTPRPNPPTTDASHHGGQLLYTPGEAADVLRVRESWLRRKAATRQIPCTFLGKHLRFSAADLAAIVAAAAQPPATRPRRRNRAAGGSTSRDPDLITPPVRSVDPPRPDDHNDTHGSSTWLG
jgi:excisionase family DNA binding protein